MFKTIAEYMFKKPLSSSLKTTEYVPCITKHHSVLTQNIYEKGFAIFKYLGKTITTWIYSGTSCKQNLYKKW